MTEPQKITQRYQWIAWRFNQFDCAKTPEQRCASCPLNGKTDATVPIRVFGCGDYASATDPTTWASYDEALIYHKRPDTRTDGVAYMLSSSGPIVGIVLERCRDPVTDEIDTWAQEIVDHVNTYTEVAETGTDLRLFAATMNPELNPNSNQGATLEPSGKIDQHEQARIAIYEDSHYLIYTGQQLPGTPDEVQTRPDVIEEIHELSFD